MQKRTSPFFWLSTLFFFFLNQSIGHSQDIKSLLSQLTAEQKLRALEYFRGLGSNIDREIQDSYQQLDKDSQSKAFRYLESVRPDDGKSKLRTTVKWSRDTIQFGVIEEGIIYLDSITVTNTGTKAYQITGSQSTCDCTILQAPKQPVLPGEKAMVRIEFNSKGKKGKVSTGIILQDNSSPNARSIVYITGIVNSKKTAKKRPWE